MPADCRKIIAIIPAAGVGSRMQANKPKQYLKINQQTVLEHSIQRFLHRPEISQILVAVAKEDPYVKSLPLYSHPKIQWVIGGQDRAHSVLNCLKALNLNNSSEEQWVLVHDAARPCVQWQNIEKLLQIQDPQGGILALPAIDTIKRADSQQCIANTEDRATLWLAQTPQFFPAKSLKQNLENALAQGLNITDEASAMEFAGLQPHLVPGRGDNLKITRPEDLALAQFYFAQENIKKENNGG